MIWAPRTASRRPSPGANYRPRVSAPPGAGGLDREQSGYSYLFRLVRAPTSPPHAGRKAKSFGWSPGAAASHPAGLCNVSAYADGAVSSGTAVAAVPSGAYAASASIATDRGRADTDGRAFPSRPPRPLFGSSPRPRWPTTGADRKNWLMSMLDVSAADPARYAWEPVNPGDPDHMGHTRRLLHVVADRARWQAQVTAGSSRE